jgi:hypothetical protein
MEHGANRQREKKGGVKVFTKINLAEEVPNYIRTRPAASIENIFLHVKKTLEF